MKVVLLPPFASCHLFLEKVDGVGGDHDSVGGADDLGLYCDDVVLMDCVS